MFLSVFTLFSEQLRGRWEQRDFFMQLSRPSEGGKGRHVHDEGQGALSGARRSQVDVGLTAMDVGHPCWCLLHTYLCSNFTTM